MLYITRLMTQQNYTSNYTREKRKTSLKFVLDFEKNSSRKLSQNKDV